MHRWPQTVAEAEAIQDRLRPLVDLTGTAPQQIRLAAGLEVGVTDHEQRRRGDAPELVGVPPGGTLTRLPAVP